VLIVAWISLLPWGHAHAADPFQDAERSIKKFESLSRIKLDLKDKSQIKDATKYLNDAKSEVSSFVYKLEKIEKDSTSSKVKDKRRKVIDRARKLKSRVEKALDKLKRAKDDPKKAKDAKSYIKDAISETRSIKSYFKDFRSVVKDEAKKAAGAGKKLLEKLKKLADTIAKVKTAANASDVKAAIAIAKDVERDAKNTKGSDQKSKEIKKTWPGIAQKFSSAAKQLGAMKDIQFTLEKDTGICSKNGKKLNSALKKYKAKPSESHHKAAKKIGADAEKHAKKTLANAKKSDGKFKTAKGKASFRASGDWSSVKSKLSGSVSGVAKAWSSAVKAHDKACGPLKNASKLEEVKGDNKKLIAKLKKLAATIAKVKTARNARDVKAAIKLAKEIEGDAKKIKSGDKSSQEIKKKWPGIAKKFSSAAKQLGAMKDIQFKLDKDTKTCAKKKKKFNAAIKKYKKKPLPEEKKKIDKLAQQLEKETKKTVVTAKKLDTKLKTAKGKARFSASGDWSTVRSKHSASVSGVARGWAKRFKAHQKACLPLARATKNKQVARAERDFEKRAKRAEKKAKSAEKKMQRKCDSMKKALARRDSAAEKWHAHNQKRLKAKQGFKELQEENDKLEAAAEAAQKKFKRAAKECIAAAKAYTKADAAWEKVHGR